MDWTLIPIEPPIVFSNAVCKILSRPVFPLFPKGLNDDIVQVLVLATQYIALLSVILGQMPLLRQFPIV